jgi:hypothetical protein
VGTNTETAICTGLLGSGVNISLRNKFVVYTSEQPSVWSVGGNIMAALLSISYPGIEPCQNQSHVTTYGRSVSQYVLVSSSLWNLWPDIIFCLKVVVLSQWGPISEERPGLSPVSHCQQYLIHCQKCNIIYIMHVTCFMYMQYILDLCQHRLSTADHAKTSVAYATTAVQTLKWSYAPPPPSLRLLRFMCLASPCPIIRTFAFPRFCITLLVACIIL